MTKLKDRPDANRTMTPGQKDNGDSVISQNPAMSTKNWKKPRDNRKLDQLATTALINNILKRG